MTTATPTLADTMRARWDDAPHENRLGTGDDAATDAIDNVIEALMAEYRIGVTATHGEFVDAAAAWTDPMETAAREAGRAAFEEHVVPAIAAVISEQISTAPDWLRIHPESEQLRADLTALEATSAG